MQYVTAETEADRQEMFPIRKKMQESQLRVQEKTENFQIDLMKYKAGTAEDDYMTMKADQLVDEAINNEMFKSSTDFGLWQTAEDGTILQDGNGNNLLRDESELMDMLTTMNDDSLSEVYKDLIASSGGKEGAKWIDYTDFADKYKAAEGHRNAQFETQIAKEIGLTDNTSPAEVLDELEKRFSGQDWYKQLLVNIEMNPNSKYNAELVTRNAKPKTSSEYVSLDSTMALEKAWSEATAFNEQLDNIYELDTKDIFDAFGQEGSDAAIKDFTRALKNTGEAIDDSRLGIKNVKGEDYLYFWEDDWGNEVENDHWIGKLTESGDIKWQKYGRKPYQLYGKWDWDNSGKVWSSADMLRETEGSGYRASGKANNYSYK